MQQILLNSSSDQYTLNFNAATNALTIAGVNNFPLVKDSIVEAYDVTAPGYIDLSQTVFTWFRSNGLPIYVYVFNAVPVGAGNGDTLNIIIELPANQKEFSLQQKQAGASAGTPGTYVGGETPAGTINGTNNVFTLANTPITGAIVLIYTPSGQPTVFLQYGIDFTVVANVITTVAPPLTGASLYAIYYK